MTNILRYDMNRLAMGVASLLAEIERATGGFMKEGEAIFELDGSVDPGSLVPMLTFKTGMMVLANMSDDNNSLVINCIPAR